MTPIQATRSAPGAELIATVRAHRPAAVLFDLDGTLVDSARANFLSLQAAWAAQGQRLPEPWYLQQTGLSVTGLAEEWSRIYRHPLDAKRAEAAFIAASTNHAETSRLYSDTTALLDDLHPGCPVGLVTNNCRLTVTAVLRAMPRLDVFATIATVDLPGLKPKPAPDLYAFAAAELGFPPSDCVAIEDSDQGIEAALAAKLKFLDIRSFRRAN